MTKFFRALKRGVQAMAEGPDAPVGDTFVVAGKPVRCAHCGHDHFEEGKAQLNTAMMTFLNLDWANQSAVTLACVRCGRIEWFLTDADGLD
jgi:hypothetical protein